MDDYEVKNSIQKTDTEAENAGGSGLEAAVQGDKKKKPMTKKQIIREILSYAFYIALAICIALLWRTFVLMKVEVISGSMENTMKKGDRLMVSKLPYIFGSVQRGDIIVFHYPDDESQIYVKRVIGLPGDEVDISEGKVRVNGVLLYEDYLGSTDTKSFGPFHVPSGCYFVLGDNRSNSHDARYWEHKYVTESQVVGKALFKYQPKIEKLYKDK